MQITRPDPFFPTNGLPAECRVTFMKSNGATSNYAFTVPATGRYTILVNDYINNDSVSAKITSSNGIGVIAERAMYWDAQGRSWADGHNSIGIKGN